MTVTNQILLPHQIVHTKFSQLPCKVEQFLGSGGQGEVYRATLSGKPVALKWYFSYTSTQEQFQAIETLIQKGSPTDRFLWPFDLAIEKKVPGFGYLMPLRPSNYKGLVDLMKRRIEPSLSSLLHAGLNLSDSFLHLHSKGLCYRDISFGNVFMAPENGDVLICDNDNVTIDGKSIIGILGTPRFMAPEIVRGDAKPGTPTDLFSLSVLLFYMLMLSHPLEGQQESSIHCLDLPAMLKIYGTHPVFIFDPQDDSNRPIPGIHDNAAIFWNIYPQLLRDTFTRAFTRGILDPLNGRVRESEWRSILAQLIDWIVPCPACGAEVFFDPVFAPSGHLSCWNCGLDIPLPFRLHNNDHIIALVNGTRLYPHHLYPRRLYDFSVPVAEVVQHPEDQTILGLKNLTKDKWVRIGEDGSLKDVLPGQSVRLTDGVKINFFNAIGLIRK